MISGYLVLSRAISGYLGLSRAILGYLGLSQAISGYHGPLEAGESKTLWFKTYLVLFFPTGYIEELTLLKIGDSLKTTKSITFHLSLVSLFSFPPFFSFFLFLSFCYSNSYFIYLNSIRYSVHFDFMNTIQYSFIFMNNYYSVFGIHKILWANTIWYLVFGNFVMNEYNSRCVL